MQAPLHKPEPPPPHACCGGGSCCPCVWDSYYQAMRDWLTAQGEPLTDIKPPADSDAADYR